MQCGREDCTGDHRNRGWSTLCGATKERQRVRQRRLRISSGTYRYKEAHGEGLPGLIDYITGRTRALIKQRKIIVENLLKADEEIKQLEEQLNG